MKGELSAETSAGGGARAVSSVNAAAPVVMGSAALDPVTASDSATAVALEEQAGPVAASGDLNSLRNAVLNALSDAGQRALVAMLETGQWSVTGSELVVKVASSAAMIDMSLGADAKRAAIAAASGAAGRAMKLRVLPGGTAQAAPARTATSNGGGRARAEQDPVVRRLQEKFGAEIRTIIDQKK
jgi:hypothetical protein